MKGKTPWNVRRLLALRYNNPTCLSDLGLTSLPGEDGVSALAAAWMMANTALASLRTLTFWLEAAVEEMEGLWKRGCFKKHRVKDRCVRAGAP